MRCPSRGMQQPELGIRAKAAVRALTDGHAQSNADRSLLQQTPLLKLPTSRSILLLTRAPEDSTSSSMALVQASSSAARPLAALPPWDAKNSTALPSRGPRPIFSLQPQLGTPEHDLQSDTGTLRGVLLRSGDTSSVCPGT